MSNWERFGDLPHSQNHLEDVRLRAFWKRNSFMTLLLPWSYTRRSRGIFGVIRSGGMETQLSNGECQHHEHVAAREGHSQCVLATLGDETVADDHGQPQQKIHSVGPHGRFGAGFLPAQFPTARE